jgi:cytochrome P450
VQERVREEVAKAGALNAAAIDSLDYLEACLHEQLRLWSPVPMLLRRATKPFVLRDQIAVEAEQQILMHAGFYHRDPKIFGEFADKFSPESALARGFPATYFFSAHRQSCVGRPLVTFLLKATLATLLTRLRFDLVGPAIDPESIPYLYDHFSVRLEV